MTEKQFQILRTEFSFVTALLFNVQALLFKDQSPMMAAFFMGIAGLLLMEISFYKFSKLRKLP